MLIDTAPVKTETLPPDATASPARPACAVSLRTLALLLGVILAFLGLLEIQTSWLEARVFTVWARQAWFAVEPGSSPAIRYPKHGPYDARLGYTRLPEFLDRLAGAGFRIESQARWSPAMARMADWGLYPPYQEKTQAGLTITGDRGEPLYAVRVPGRIYPDFEAIPPVIVRTLLFVENREALDARYPYKNPAIEWDRLARAVWNYSLVSLGLGGELTGGSTLATQLVKFRHSPGGKTTSPGEKLRQVVSASLAAYATGLDTTDARRRIIADYLNSVPLAAVPGYGEVHGLGDGLSAWYGADFREVNRLLDYVQEPVAGSLDQQARAYRQVLSLLLAIKRPTAYLIRDRAALERRVDSYLHLLAEAGVIPERLARRALAVRPRLRDRAPSPPHTGFAPRKATDRIRVHLMQKLGLPSTYEVDRLDLAVESTIDGDAQRRIFAFLDRLNEPEFAARAGLRQPRLLERGDPRRVIYSITLYERGQGANLLRVQADNLDQPLNINEQTKLELGSTAKLRTLASYLEAIRELHARLSAMTPAERARLEIAPEDRLTRWAAAYLDAFPEATLEQMLEAAMERRYSASPAEGFFTGGGMHHFSNFDSKDDTRVITVREAFRRSVNLVFIRLMRDLVNYRIYRLAGVTPSLLRDPSHPARRRYLERYAEREGRKLITRYYQKYQGLPLDEALSRLAEGMQHKTPRRLAAVYRSVRPQDGVDGFAAFLIGHLLNPNLPQSLIERLYAEFEPGRYSLADRAYIAGIDPLELWVLQYKAANPGAQLGELFRVSRPYCLEAFDWLFKPRNRRAQNRAIRVMLEVDAFRVLHAEWRKLGYPFPWLVPSYATALGSSGDTPAALADLVGIIENEGVYYPAVRIEKLHFAADTPYETNLVRDPRPGERVMAPEIARLLDRELTGVVEAGTAIRTRGALKLSDGTPVRVGGKTGTGDNRYEMYGPGGRLIESRVVNRTATFVFTIGGRYFGAITAFVPGEQAAEYGFTSSLPVQIFKELTPVFAAMLEGRPAPDLAGAIEKRVLTEARRPEDAPELAANTGPGAAGADATLAGRQDGPRQEAGRVAAASSDLPEPGLQ